MFTVLAQHLYLSCAPGSMGAKICAKILVE